MQDLPHVVQNNFVSFSSYPFLELEGLAALDPEDVAFLNAKGCLEVPEPALLDDFVRQYFQHIHPCTPVIDEAVFWKLYRQEPEDPQAPKVSLLFFQALLFASSPYISLETAQGCGFEDNRAAWNALYRRAKVVSLFSYCKLHTDRGRSFFISKVEMARQYKQQARLRFS